ncbi:right-handed parallel beta-helix repeat-containing protein [Corallococcus aberystwythensis]|uniref:Right-handed parallel beta-helix repeat-containing protein n=1 Tax=Corallococcus aberystwythensis TaxID=2316722 RepID=A0A3A8QKY0_9BACT|nr:right-handed parallel beta-helix repeat-containing protein [Corallococcus aberystwythensis]RKH67025.1 right-handed parallel beta-helix repeat-containing protein [Corallococcus aberystwythensis]
MNRSATLYTVLSVLCLLGGGAGCSDEAGPMEEMPSEIVPDSGTPTRDDAGTPDRDAGTPDRDAGTPDAGASDGGTDAGTLDAGTADGGVVIPQDGGTQVTGTMPVRLTLAGSPYRVVGNAQYVVTIPKGQTTTVEPGVVIDFKGNPAVTNADVRDGAQDVMNHQNGRVELRVYGRILVQGTASAPVTLTSTNPHGWWGMNFFGAQSKGDGDPVFQHMVFEKVRKNEYNGDRDRTRGALWAYYPGPVTIEHSLFRDNESSGACGALDLMFTDGSVVTDTVFENNRTRDIDRFATGDGATSAGGAMCVTHGRNSIVRGNTFRNNTLSAFRGSQSNALQPRAYEVWPNGTNHYDLGGGGALHYFQPDNDLIENNRFENNAAVRGPGAAIYLEDVPNTGATLRGNTFTGNQGGAGGVIVCNRGSGNATELVLGAGNTFSGNTVNGAAAPQVTGDCAR